MKTVSLGLLGNGSRGGGSGLPVLLTVKVPEEIQPKNLYNKYNRTDLLHHISFIGLLLFKLEVCTCKICSSVIRFKHILYPYFGRY
jgi:hypothetical protein